MPYRNIGTISAITSVLSVLVNDTRFQCSWTLYGSLETIISLGTTGPTAALPIRVAVVAWRLTQWRSYTGPKIAVANQ